MFCCNFQLVAKLEKGSAYPLHSETTLEIQPPPTTTITTTTTTTIIHPSCSKQLFTNVLLERRTGHRRKERRVSLARVPPRNHVPAINTIDYWASLNLQTQGRKRLAFTIKQKMKIIQEIERGKSKSDVARELGLASSTVATIWKNRESIAESWRNRDMMQQHSDVEDPVAKKTGLPSASSNLASVTSLVTNSTVLNTVNATNNTTTSTTLPTAVVVPPPQVQVVPPPPPPPPPSERVGFFRRPFCPARTRQSRLRSLKWRDHEN